MLTSLPKDMSFFYSATYLIFKIEIQLVYNIMLVSGVQCNVLSFSILQILYYCLLRTLVSNKKQTVLPVVLPMDIHKGNCFSVYFQDFVFILVVSSLIIMWIGLVSFEVILSYSCIFMFFTKFMFSLIMSTFFSAFLSFPFPVRT